MDLDDTHAAIFKARADDGGDITNLRFYLDSTSYYYIDTVTYAASKATITSFTINSTSGANVITFDATVEISGAWSYTDS